MFDGKYIPFALALYSQEYNGKQLLCSRATQFGMRRWFILNVVIVPILFYQAQYTIREHRRLKAQKKKDGLAWERYMKEFQAWKANGKEIPYND